MKTDDKPSLLRRLFRPSYSDRLSATGYLFVAPALAIMLVFVLLPFVLALWQSLFTGFGQNQKFVGLENYIEIFTSERFWNSILVTIVFTAISTGLSGTLGFLIANWLVRRQIRFSRGFTSFIFLPYVVTPAIATLVWQYMYDRRFGILNAALEGIGIDGVAWLGTPVSALASLIVVQVWFTVGYNMVIFSAGLQSIPSDYYESAAIAGATDRQQTLKITLPLVVPTMVLVLVLSLLAGFVNSFVIAQILTDGGPFRGTEVLMLFIYKTAFEGFDIPKANALSLIMFAMLFLTAHQLQRWQDRVYHGLY